jgi:phosphoribosylformylglycinamidine synthase
MGQNSAMPLVRVTVLLKPDLLDSAGRAVADSLHRIGFEEVAQARIGRVIELEVPEVDEERIQAMCRRLLSNPVTEEWSYEVAG